MRKLFSSKIVFYNLGLSKFGDSFLIPDIFLSLFMPFVIVSDPWGKRRALPFLLVSLTFFYKLVRGPYHYRRFSSKFQAVKSFFRAVMFVVYLRAALLYLSDSLVYG
jgi:hypothetical protein